MTSLLGHSEMQCNCMYFDVVLETCGDWYDKFCWSYCNVMLLYVNFGYLTFYLKLVTTVTTGLVGRT